MSEIRLLELSRFLVCETFSVGQETVATGIVQRGFIEAGDELVVVTPSGKHYVVKCCRIESFDKESNGMISRELAGEGDTVGLRLVGASKQQIEIGSLICRFKLSLN